MIWTSHRKALAYDSLVKWRGTPHRNRMAEVGVGIDCVHLLHEVITDAGVVQTRVQFGGYDVQDGQFDVSERLQNIVQDCLHVAPASIEQMEFGDIVIFKTGKRSGHLGFYDGASIWHALADRCVTKSQLALWRHDIAVNLRLTELGWKNHPQQSVRKFL